MGSVIDALMLENVAVSIFPSVIGNTTVAVAGEPLTR